MQSPMTQGRAQKVEVFVFYKDSYSMQNTAQLLIYRCRKRGSGVKAGGGGNQTKLSWVPLLTAFFFSGGKGFNGCQKVGMGKNKPADILYIAIQD